MSDEIDPNKVESVDVKAEVTFRRYPARTLFMREAAVSGELEGVSFEGTVNISDGAPIVRFEEGDWFVLPWRSILNAVYSALEEKEAAS